MEHKYFEDQLDDEEVLFVFRKHPVVMRRGLIFGMLAWLVGPVYTIVISYLRPNEIPSLTFFFGSLAVSILIGVVIFIPFWVPWYFSVCIVTNRRFVQIKQEGFFTRHVSDINLNQIQSMNYSIEGLEETLLGFGTIVLQTYIGEVKLHYIHHPAVTQKKIQSIMNEQHMTPVAHAGNQQG